MIRILVVDDHALVRRGLIQILQGFPDGVQFGEAGTAAEAMSLASNERWDVVLLDLGLPDRHRRHHLTDQPLRTSRRTRGPRDDVENHEPYLKVLFIDVGNPGDGAS